MFPGENREPLDYRPQPPAVTDQVTTEVRTIPRFLARGGTGVEAPAGMIRSSCNLCTPLNAA
jgi:hypothetical protein